MAELPSIPPIGHWLKRADYLITQHTNRVQAVNNVSRFEWQVLNFLHDGGTADKERIFRAMKIFIDADELDATLDRLSKLGWMERTTGADGEQMFGLTHSGEQHHAVVHASQKIAREKVMQGISEEEHATMLRVLQRIVSNLDFEDQG